MDIKDIGNIITNEKGNCDRNPTGNSFDKDNSQRKVPGDNINDQAQQMRQISPCRVIQQQQNGVSRAT